MKRVMGIRYGHDASVALIINGQIIANVAEERFTHTKNNCPFQIINVVAQREKLLYMQTKFKSWLDQVNDSLPFFVETLRQPDQAGRYFPCLNGSTEYPLGRRIQAAQMLNTLDFALLLGFEQEGLHELRSTCLAALGLKRQAQAAREIAKLHQGMDTQRSLGNSYSKFFDRIHYFLGDRVWKLLRRALSKSLPSLILIWIVGIMVLYLLLFSPQLYWSILGHLGIAPILDIWRSHIIALFGLDKAFH